MSDTPTVVPHSIEAEQATLGAIFIDGTVLSDVALVLPSPNMFYRRSHQVIYKVMLALRDYGAEIDWVHVLEGVQKSGEMEACGGREMLSAYLSEISHSVPSAYGATGYAMIVRDRFTLREAVYTAGELKRIALDPTKSPGEIVEAFERRVVSLDAARYSSVMLPVGHLVDSVVREHANRKLLREKGAQALPGVSSGFADVDLHTAGWRGGQFIVFGARPGDGKTSMLIELARRMADPEVAVKVEPGAMISLEMTAEELVHKLACNVAGVDTLAVKLGKLDQEEEFRLEEAADKIKTWPIHLDMGRRGMTMRQIRSKAQQAVETFGAKWVMIDYLQIIKKRWFKQDTLDHLNETSSACKQLAREINVPVISAVQLKRPPTKMASRRRPSMDELKGSGNIEQDADQVFLIFPRNKERTKVAIDLILDKNREGPTGTISMDFYPLSGRFELAQVEQRNETYPNYTEPQRPEDDNEDARAAVERALREKNKG